MNNSIISKFLVLLLVITVAACSDDEIGSPDLPLEYSFVKSEVLEYETYVWEDGQAVQIDNEAADVSAFDDFLNTPQFDSIRLLNENMIRYDDGFGPTTTEFTYDYNSVDVNIDGQRVAFRYSNSEWENLTFRGVQSGTFFDGNYFVGSFCGSRVNCQRIEASDWIWDFGFLENGDKIFLLVYEQTWERI